MIWVAYNSYGDLIAEADSEELLCLLIEEHHDVALVGRVAP